MIMPRASTPASARSPGPVRSSFASRQCARAPFDAALRIEPKLARSLFGRDIARRRTGDSGGGNADIEAATAIDNTVAGWLARYHLKP
jgi:hypothetical protein